jgi:hypothetical protein
MAKTTEKTKTKTSTVTVPRVADRRLYGKFEVPFQTGKPSVTVLIPLSEMTPGTTVTLTIAHDAAE